MLDANPTSRFGWIVTAVAPLLRADGRPPGPESARACRLCPILVEPERTSKSLKCRDLKVFKVQRRV